MARKAVDLTGQVFGYLTVVGRAGSNGRRRAMWSAKCVCGETVELVGQNLRNKNRGPLKSCGCRRGEMLLDAWGSHGMTSHPAYHSWQGLRQRCNNATSKDYRNYGARGITVCARWEESFENFWEDMGPAWAAGLSIERTNNSKGYAPGNCRWATAKDQGNNTRMNVVLATPMGVMTLEQAAELYGINSITLSARLGRYGWPLERALTTPARRSKPSTC